MTKRVSDGNGWYEVKGNPLSKVGVFPYRGSSIGAPDADRIYNVYRPAEELSSQATIDSFKLLPWIDDHEMLGGSFTPAEDKGIHGIIGENVYFDADDGPGVLKANLKIFSTKHAKRVDSGKKQLSAGYRCVYDFVTGVWNGEPYDAVQRNMRGNHVASVNQGRMGPDVAVQDSNHDCLQITFDAKDITMDVQAALDAANEKIAELTAQQVARDEADKKAKEDAEAAEKAAKDEADAKAKKDDEEKGKSGMDAAMDLIAKLNAKVTQLESGNFKAVMAEASQRDALAGKVSTLIGSFDHSEMTVAEVAKYAVGKLQIPTVDGHEEAVLLGYLAGRDPAKAGIGFAADAADTGGTDLDTFFKN